MEDFFYLNIGDLFEWEGDLLVKIRPFICDYDGGYYTALYIDSDIPARVNRFFCVFDNTKVHKINNITEWKKGG